MTINRDSTIPLEGWGKHRNFDTNRKILAHEAFLE